MPETTPQALSRGIARERRRRQRLEKAQCDPSKPPMTDEEFRGYLEAQVRSGSVQAMRLWAELYREPADTDDKFAALDAA